MIVLPLLGIALGLLYFALGRRPVWMIGLAATLLVVALCIPS